jgi:hypothetical protein
MAEYRAYVVGLDGHFIGYEPLVCEDDPEAVTKAERLVDGRRSWRPLHFLTELRVTMPL